jgi:4-amino-4-deoxy-L-arabinose transferase-like glycosyltransferase
VAGLVPMTSFISASVSPDGMMYALWTFFLWLGGRALRRGIDVPTALALAGVVGIALTVKGTSYALVPALAFVLLVGLWRRRREPGRRAIAVVGSALAALACTAGFWALIARSLDRSASGQLVGAEGGAVFNLKQFLGYVWQFYLPKLPFQEPWPTSVGLPLYEIFLKGAWGMFGWLEVPMAEAVYVLLAVLTGATFLAAGVALWRTRRTFDLPVAIFFLLVVTALLAGLHWTEYHYILNGNVGFMQGRYILPLIGLWGAVLAEALTLLRPDRRPTAVALVVGLLVALQLYGLGLVVERYYA